MGNFLWGIHHQEFPRESQWRIHHGEFTMGNSPWIWFPGHSSWIHQFAWGEESDSPRGIPHGEFSCGEFMWIFPVNSPQVSNEQYCTPYWGRCKTPYLHFLMTFDVWFWRQKSSNEKWEKWQDSHNGHKPAVYNAFSQISGHFCHHFYPFFADISVNSQPIFM